MIMNFKKLSDLYEKTVSSVTSSPEEWTKYLGCSSRNYKLRFDEQLLIYAQRPDATAVLEMERWNKKFGRWVNRKATSISVFVDKDRKIKRIRHYFDISDTHESKNAKPVPMWQMNRLYKREIIKTLSYNFGISSKISSLEEAIINTVTSIYDENISDYTDELLENVQDSFLEGLSEEAISVMYRQLVTSSMAYTIMTRLGLDAKRCFENEDFRDITNFNTRGALCALGFATSDMSEIALTQIAKAVNALDKSRNSAENKKEINTDRRLQNEQLNKSIDGRNNIHRDRRDLLPEPDSRGGARNGTRDIRTTEREISERTPQDNILQLPDGGNSGRTLDGSRKESTRDDRQLNRADESSAWSDRRTQEERPNGLGAGDEQHHKRSERNSKRRSDLRLERYDDKNEDKNLPFYGSCDEIREMLLSTPHLKATNAEILAYYTNEKNENKRAEYIKGIFNTDFTEIIVSDNKHCGYKAYDNGLIVWEGAYLTRTKQAFYKWSRIANYFDTARMLGELTNGYLNPFNGAEDKTSAFVFPQEIIDLDICRGSGFAEGKLRIYEQFQKSLSLKDNANFLKNEYGIGGHNSIVEGASINQDHNSNGLTYSYGYKKNRPKLTLNWIDVARRIQQLINQDLYLTEKEKQKYPEWIDEQEKHRAELTLQKKNLEILSVAPETLKTPIVEYDYRYKLGDTVYIGSEEHQILSLDDNRVLLYDVKYPLFNKELTIEKFDTKIKENPLNDHLKVIKSNDSKIIEAEKQPKAKDIEKQSIYEQFTEQWNEYSQIKEKHADSIILYQVGDFFEIMGADAEKFAEITDVELLSKRVSKEHTVAMCGIPNFKLEENVTLIRQNGYSIILASVENGEIVLKGMEAEGTAHIPFEADYRLLSRLKQDCEYYLGHGSKSDKHLWAGNVDSQIAKMRELYDKLPDKPEWLSEQDIDDFEAKMKNNVVELSTEKPDKSTVVQPNIPLSARHNFKLSDNDVELVSKKERFRRNVKAINILKECEFDNRLATPEEQIALSKYVGWGGIPEAFDENNSSWSNEFKELYVTLSPDEYASARESTLTAFYTPSEVISSMYQALVNLGFKNGNILEPSCGTGNFIGMLPDTMVQSKIHGVELDAVSAKIAQQLYQKVSIASQGFEETSLPDNFFDVVIGNVPFGDFKVIDKRYDKHNFLIHDYFFAKSLDKLRPGGIMALITSSGTMDKKNSHVRRYLSQRADLLGAIRLPNTTFSGNAGTEVVSDILFLQKRERMVDYDTDWLHTITDEKGNEINEYFVNHPEMVLGELKTVSGRFGPKLTCAPKSGAILKDLLSNAIVNITGTYKEAVIESETTTQSVETLPADPSVRNFSYTLVNDKIYFRENSVMILEEPSATATVRIKGMIEIRDSVRRLIELQSENYPEADIQSEQKHLNKCYDRYIKKYDNLNSRANKLAFKKDSSYPLLSSLEITDENGKFVAKADMFTKRTITPHIPVTSVDTSTEALTLSLGEKAYVDMEYMQELTGKTEQEIFDDLKGVIFLNPLYKYGNHPEGKYLMADEYLSGNVRKKLLIAESSAQLYPEDYSINVEALKKVQPKDLSASEISVRLGSTWIPPEDIKDFIFEILTPNSYAKYNIKVHYSEHTGEWRIDGKASDGYNVKANTTYGTQRANAYKIIENALNLVDVRVFDYIDKPDGGTKAVLNKKETALAQAKQEQIKQAFQDWIWKDPNRRDRLTKSYNEKFNSLRPREFDGSHINFVGMNPEIKLKPHQQNAVAHILYGGNTLLAHAVGAGKSFEMTAAAKELKRLGLCSKPMFVVPNHLTEQWASEFLRLYPASNILVATKKDFERKNRQRFCGRIATGDYDAIIIGHSQFEKIPMSVEYQRHSLESQIDEIVDEIAKLKYDSGSRFTVKELEKTKKSLSNKLHKLNDQSRKDDIVTFEELGVDRLFVDESHYYKNLYLYTKMRNVGGIAQTEAQKASDLFMKCRYLDSITNNKGVVFATGTPISNSMVELYTIQRYLQYSTLVNHNLQHFDSWASTFGETISAIELTPEGKGYRSKTRFAKFHNLPELMSMFKEVADIQTADMLNLPVPKATYVNVAVKPSEFQKEIVNSLADRAEKIRSGNVDSSIDNMLKITNDGRNLALDQRLIDDSLPDFEGSKTNACVDNIYRIWEETKDKKSTQLVFCDLSTPKNDGSFSVYNDIKKKLIERGIPEKEIEFIHDAKTDSQKQKLFQRTRNGDVRVLMGSTQKMGAGTNVQDKLVALHDLDCPWRPADLEQRSGRIVRQGNTNEEVFIYRYVTEETFDAYLYQLVEGKQKFASQIMTSKSPARSAEDVDATALSYAEIKMLATGNPYIKEKMDLDIQVQKLNLLKSDHLTVKYSLEDRIIKYYPQQIAYLTNKVAGLKDDLATVKAHPRGDKDNFGFMEINEVIYNERALAGQALIEACSGIKTPKAVPIGKYRGFTLELLFDVYDRKYNVNIKGSTTTKVELSVDNVGNITRIDNAIDKCSERLAVTENQLQETYNQFENAKIEVTKPFQHEDELNRKLERLNELNALLNVDEKVIEVADTPNEANHSKNVQNKEEKSQER